MKTFHSSKPSKYRAEPTVIDGIRFDSKGEAKRYTYLKELEEMGVIENLKRQQKYVLIPSQYDFGVITKKGTFRKGKLLERECAYKSDFEYEYKGEHIVEDFKGMKTDSYRIKRKLMLWKHGVRIYEARKWNEPPGGGA